jgi:hypothetical protein
VRADCRVIPFPNDELQLGYNPTSLSEFRVLKKDEVIDWNNCIVRIMTNKRCKWQKINTAKKTNNISGK